MYKLFFISFFCFIFFCCKESTLSQTKDGYINKTTYKGEKNFLTGYPPINADGSINLIVEIPAGTNEKWEVNKEDGTMIWDKENGEVRRINYLSYPGNYGMVPRTLLPKSQGGDGDPLDVIALGPAAKRGEILQVKLLGVLQLLDGGEVDDKLIAAAKGTPFYELNTLAELDSNYTGITNILTTWFSNYKGPGEMKLKKINDEKEARRILNIAIEAYQK